MMNNDKNTNAQQSMMDNNVNNNDNYNQQQNTINEQQLEQRPYCCTIEITVQSYKQASNIIRIMSVDKELSNATIRTFYIKDNILSSLNKTNEVTTTTTTTTTTTAAAAAILVVSFSSTNAKSLRVSVTSFYDYLSVCFKCYQEFSNDTNDF